jgi:predicted DNA-binding WGR domain protein
MALEMRADWPKMPRPIYLERIDVPRRMARFYAIRVELTLFGDWAVICHWGRIGARGQYNERWLSTQAEACEARDRQLTRKMRRGYMAPTVN